MVTYFNLRGKVDVPDQPRQGSAVCRNRYRIQAHLPLPEPAGQERTVGEVLALLAGADAT
jgi:hypothetical protein